MPLHKGHGPDIVKKNIMEMISAGHDPKQAVAASLSSARKYKKMADGGLVDDDEGLGSNDNESAVRSIAELQDQADMNPSHVENPEEESHARMLAKALYEKSEDMEMMSDGGEVEGMDGDEMPDEHMASSMDEPMSVEPMAPGPEKEDSMEHLSVMAREALRAKKKMRKFS